MCAGKPMGWSDDWWLMLNTITGVLGFVFSFLVRYAIRRDHERLTLGFEMLMAQDMNQLHLLRINQVSNMFTQDLSIASVCMAAQRSCGC